VFPHGTLLVAAAHVPERPSSPLVRLRPWPDILYVSRGRTVLATDRDGFFDKGSQRGLFVH
jgi:hypothetical protein